MYTEHRARVNNLLALLRIYKSQPEDSDLRRKARLMGQHYMNEINAE